MSSSSDERLSPTSSADSYSRSRKRSSNDDRKRKRSSRRSESHRKKSSRKRERESRRRDDDDDDDDTSIDDYVDESRKSSRKRRKKERKKEHKSDRKKHKKKSRKKHRDEYDSRSSDVDESNQIPSHLMDRNHALAHALCSLFDDHPALASDLPLMLIRLAGGASFDLSQMTNIGAAQGLARVFECLAAFGVEQQGTSATAPWVWKNPAGPSSSGGKSDTDLVLIRVVRATLDQIGLTHQAVLDFENPPLRNAETNAPSQTLDPSANGNSMATERVEKSARELLRTFDNMDLATELTGLCQIILDGEVVALDGLPDEKLRTQLESLLVSCGLEKTEMEVEDCSDHDNGADAAPAADAAASVGARPESTMGFGLPEARVEQAHAMLQRVLNVCTASKEAKRVRVKGPMPLDQYMEQNGDDDDAVMDSSGDEHDGPLPVGAAELNRAATLSHEQVKVAAARRAKELACAKQGIEFDPDVHDNVREEWMVVPGKFDFLSTIQTGQPIRSRQFEAKGKLVATSGGAKHEASVDAATRAEIHAIRNAYDAARGRSLMEEHHEAKKLRAAEEQAQKGGQSESSSWKWNRDKDIDAGRRVDKDALNMILGGASSDLKSKFQSGS